MTWRETAGLLQRELTTITNRYYNFGDKCTLKTKNDNRGRREPLARLEEYQV